jgi:magnesium-transporting ATPase (P-type)
MSDAFQGMIAIVLSLILGLELVVTASQILWINIISDGFPSLALTIDPKSKGIMNRPPRPPTENLVAGWIKILISIVSILGGITSFALYLYVLRTFDSVEFARSVAFAALGINSLVYVFSVKTLKEPFWKESIFGNRWLVVAVVAGAFLQVFPFLFERTRIFFDITPLGIYWLLPISAAFLMFLIIESAKWFFRGHLKKK